MTSLNIKKYSQIIGNGAKATIAASIFKGMLVGLFRDNRVDIKTVNEWVQADKSFLDSLNPEQKRQLKQLASKMGDMNFITTEWVIDALREDFPAVASLFLGWEKGRNWLARQVERIKAEL